MCKDLFNFNMTVDLWTATRKDWFLGISHLNISEAAPNTTRTVIGVGFLALGINVCRPPVQDTYMNAL
jgi:hypothetical protein